MATAMLAATTSLSATTFTRVDLPDPVTETSSGVNITTNTYTHAINFGNGSTTDVDINGLVFDTKNLAATVTDDNRAGNTINATIAVAGTLGNNGGNASVKAEAGDMKTVMQPFGFHSSAGSGTMSFTINNLTPGQSYVARFYNYQWDPSATSRTLRVSTNLDSDTADIDWGGGTRYRCFYIEVSYTPTGTSAQINFQALDPNSGAHISAITNHSAAAVAPVKWSGQTNALWNETDVNFTGQSFGGFKTSGGSKVIFADTDGNSAPVANTSITVDSAGVSIADIAFENTTAVSYSIDSAGGSGITGTTIVSKTGNGAVSLSGSHSYTGNTNVLSGTLTLDAAFLSDSSTVRVDTGAELHLTHSENDFVNSLILDGTAQANGVYDSSNTGGRITGTGKIVVFSGGINRWTGASDLSWDNVLNWNVPLVPNSNQHTANFEFDAPASETTITLDGSKTVDALSFDDTSEPAEGDLKFVAGSDPLSTLTANTVTVADVGRTATFQTGNAIPMIFTKNGLGTLVIKDDTTSRAATLIVNSGTIRLENSTGLSSTVTGGMNILGGATVVSDATIGGSWTGSTWLIGQGGTGTLVNKNGSIVVPASIDIAVGNNTNADGTIKIEGGSMTFAQGTGSKAWIMMGRDPQAGGVQTGRIFLEGGILETSRSFVASGSNPSTDYLTEFYLDGGILKAESGIAVDATYGWFQASSNGNALPLSGVYVRDGGAIFDTNGGDALIAAALVEDGSQPGGGLTKQGLGTLTLSGANAYTGNTVVTGGVLSIATDDVLSDTATVTLANGGSLALTHSGTDIVGALVINGVTQSNGVYAFGTGSLQVGTSTPFQLWAVAKGLDGTGGKENGPSDDPDNDGNTNLAEFAFNGDPLSGSDNGKVFILTADTDADTTKELILTIAVRSGAPTFVGTPSPSSVIDGVTYTINGSLDLSAFATQVNVVVPQTTGLPGAGAGYEYRSFSLDGSDGLAGKGFLRAVVQH